MMPKEHLYALGKELFATVGQVLVKVLRRGPRRNLGVSYLTFVILTIQRKIATWMLGGQPPMGPFIHMKLASV